MNKNLVIWHLFSVSLTHVNCFLKGQRIFSQRIYILSITSSLSLSKVVQPQWSCTSVSFLMAYPLLNQLETLLIEMQVGLFIDSASLDSLNQPSQTGHLLLFWLQSSFHQTQGTQLFTGRIRVRVSAPSPTWRTPHMG